LFHSNYGANESDGYHQLSRVPLVEAIGDDFRCFSSRKSWLRRLICELLMVGRLSTDLVCFLDGLATGHQSFSGEQFWNEAGLSN
jgi:hypothetical protein